MPEVRCTVENCAYWAAGNLCGARRILITSDAVSQFFGEAFGGDGETMLAETVGGTPVGRGVETACKTFRHRHPGGDRPTEGIRGEEGFW